MTDAELNRSNCRCKYCSRKTATWIMTSAVLGYLSRVYCFCKMIVNGKKDNDSRSQRLPDLVFWERCWEYHVLITSSWTSNEITVSREERWPLSRSFIFLWNVVVLLITFLHDSGEENFPMSSESTEDTVLNRSFWRASNWCIRCRISQYFSSRNCNKSISSFQPQPVCIRTSSGVKEKIEKGRCARKQHSATCWGQTMVDFFRCCLQNTWESRALVNILTREPVEHKHFCFWTKT